MRITDDLEIKLRELARLKKEKAEKILTSLIETEYEKISNITSTISGVYKVTCIENQKVYIGKSKNIRKRWKEHESDATGRFKKALEKFGIENFIFEVLEECEDETKIELAELKYIMKYRSYNPKYGYNTYVPSFLVEGFALDIRALISMRTSRSLDQDVLASRLGIKEQQLVNIEKGKQVPSKSLLLMLSDELGCQVEDLII